MNAHIKLLKSDIKVIKLTLKFKIGAKCMFFPDRFVLPFVCITKRSFYFQMTAHWSLDSAKQVHTLWRMMMIMIRGEVGGIWVTGLMKTKEIQDVWENFNNFLIEWGKRWKGGNSLFIYHKTVKTKHQFIVNTKVIDLVLKRTVASNSSRREEMGISRAAGWTHL